VNTTSVVISQITRVRNLVNGTPSRFNLLAGDMCYAQAQGDLQPIINPDGPDGTQPSSHNTPRPAPNSGGWDYYDPWVWSSWFPMIEPSAASIPWMVATGNHDAELFSAQVAADAVTVRDYDPHGYGGLVKRMDLPANGPSACPSVYSFRYGNVGILSLDANDLSWEIQGLLGYSQGAQVAWLTEQLATWRNDNVVDFIVAFFHECAFSTCDGHSSDGGVRSSLAPLFAQYQVDLVIQGHRERPAPRTTAGPGHGRPTATSRPAGAAGPPWWGTRRSRPGRGSTRGTSASGSRPLTGPRHGTTTTVSSRSTSCQPRPGRRPR
jgi:hypothetical protein